VPSREILPAASHLSAKAGNPKTALFEKDGDLRKHALRPSPAGDMIGALGMATTPERQ
jgi:hypothetical protein